MFSDKKCAKSQPVEKTFTQGQIFEICRLKRKRRKMNLKRKRRKMNTKPGKIHSWITARSNWYFRIVFRRERLTTKVFSILIQLIRKWKSRQSCCNELIRVWEKERLIPKSFNSERDFSPFYGDKYCNFCPALPFHTVTKTMKLILCFYCINLDKRVDCSE